MARTSSPSIVLSGNPKCPRCGGRTFDLERKTTEADGVTKTSTVYWCNNSACNVNEKGTWEGGWFYTLDDIERFNAAAATIGE